MMRAPRLSSATVRAMRRMRRSFGHSIDGFIHAVQMERNLQIFLPVYAAVLIAGVFIGLLTWEWLALILAGFTFIAIELLNTAIERLTDVLDDQRKAQGRTHYHSLFKAAKDLGAAASLMSLIATIATVSFVFWPYLQLYF